MTQSFQQPQQQVKIRTATVLMFKGSPSPVVLYFENPKAVFDEIKQLMKSATPTLIEKDALGPIKKVCFMSNAIMSVILQDEQYT